MNSKYAGIKKTQGMWFDITNYSFMIFLAFITIYPFWYCLIGSLNEGFDYFKGGVYFFPRKFSIDNYRIVLRTDGILSSYRITIIRTFLGTSLHLIVTSLFAYAYSRRDLKGKVFYAYYGLITMYFSGGFIPQYLLYKWFGLLDNFFVYIFPSAINFFSVIIMQSFFKTIPESINESAKLDGATEFRIFFSLIVPLSKPVLAAITLFQGVYHWNAFRDSIMFTQSSYLQTIQVYLMNIIKSTEYAAQLALESGEILVDRGTVNSETLKLATMIITTLPILVLYPFLQKYFVKGIMIGSIKG